MMPLVLIGVIIGLPILLALFLRINAVLLFFAMVSGVLLQRIIGKSTELALAAVAKDAPVNYIANIGLVVLPVLLTVVFLRKSAKKSQVLLQIVPLLIAGLAFGALLVPLLPDATEAQIYAIDSFGPVFRQSQDLIVAVAVAVNLLLAFHIYRHKEDPKHGKHHS